MFAECNRHYLRDEVVKRWGWLWLKPQLPTVAQGREPAGIHTSRQCNRSGLLSALRHPFCNSPSQCRDRNLLLRIRVLRGGSNVLLADSSAFAATRQVGQLDTKFAGNVTRSWRDGHISGWGLALY